LLGKVLQEKKGARFILLGFSICAEIFKLQIF